MYDLVEAERTQAPAAAPQGLPWIGVCRNAPYFEDEAGRPFTPIGQNDSIAWFELDGLFRRRDLPGVEAHLRWLADHGVTVLRLMLECAQGRRRFFERRIGVYNPAMVQVWDDLFALCEKVGLRILLTPFDTFWTWINWRHHPYNLANGGVLDRPARLLVCPQTRDAIKARLVFAAERWGGSGALFAWDLWNEIHPAQAQESAEGFPEFIADLSSAVRDVEQRRFGRSHPQTVSLFGPELTLRGHMPLTDPIFRHPALDFANLHVYAKGAIDNPKDTVAGAVAMGEVVRESLAEIADGRPFFDSEHGPIHAFKDRGRTLPEAFDDEYFRHIAWAHLASGGAGGGMRWPNRHPHALTPGMRRAQAAMSRFLPLIDWVGFRRRNLNHEVRLSRKSAAAFACGDDRQAVVWLLRRAGLTPDGRLRRDLSCPGMEVFLPGLAPGAYKVTTWDTAAGEELEHYRVEAAGQGLTIPVRSFVADLALAVRRG